METKNKLLRGLPKVDDCIARVYSSISLEIPQALVKKCIQQVIARERKKILLDNPPYEMPAESRWNDLFLSEIAQKNESNLKQVINATGVVIHTNLGRSVLSDKAAEAVGRAATHYSNLELNLNTGKRGSRYSLVEEILCDITGCEAAIVVNNNAAAVLIVLATLAKEREVIVSRGQLVEIGGSFRIPDVLEKSGARLVEVGTTNRTHLADYQKAITAETAILLKVHSSNFRVIGFASEVSAEELVGLAREHCLVTVEDLGSGCLVDLSRFGLASEPTVQEVVREGVDVVTFSGDKLLGGPQAGIIVGKAECIKKIKANPLNRALRIDKFTLAALEATLREYYSVEDALAHLPTLAMLTISQDLVKKRAQKLKNRIQRTLKENCAVEIVAAKSKVGGGAMPEYTLPSWAVTLSPKNCNSNTLEQDMRYFKPPVIGRIDNDRLMLDMRTVFDNQIPQLANLLKAYFNRSKE